MTTIRNRRLVADELTASADAYRRAIDGPSVTIEAEAGERWNHALKAAAALLNADPVAAPDEFRPGDRVLWLDAALTGYGEPLDIEHATIRDEAYPDSTAPEEERAERWYVLECDSDWSAPTERIVRAGDLIALPPAPVQEIRRAG